LVFMYTGRAYLCRAYVKDSDATDRREQAKFKGHANLIIQGKHTERGYL
jgi:hypothetical protein